MKYAEIKTRNGEKGVLCRCGEFKAFGVYAVAQMAMGHTVMRNCGCGLHIEIEDGEIVSLGEGHRFPAGAWTEPAS